MTERSETCSDDEDTASEHHERSLQKCQTFIVLSIITCVLVVMCIVGIAVLAILGLKGHGTPTQSNQTCLKCETLSTIVDRWAWKDVSEDEHTDKCCFNSDIGLAATLKYYVEKRISSSLAETERRQENVGQLYTLVWNQLLSNITNATSMPPFTHPDLSTLMNLIKNVFNRKRSVLHLTSLNTVKAEGASLTISWSTILQQGDVFLSNDTCSVSIMNTARYFISTQVKFCTDINDRTMSVDVKFYIAALRQGILTHIDDYKTQYVFRGRKIEHDANLLSMTRLEKGDTVFIRFPSSQQLYLANKRGAHRIIMIELL